MGRKSSDRTRSGFGVLSILCAVSKNVKNVNRCASCDVCVKRCVCVSIYEGCLWAMETHLLLQEIFTCPPQALTLLLDIFQSLQHLSNLPFSLFQDFDKSITVFPEPNDLPKMVSVQAILLMFC